MSKKAELIITAAILVSSALVLALLTVHSRDGRTYAHIACPLQEPMDAYQAWSEANIRGRILLQFDRKLSVKPEDGQLSNDNFVHIALKKHIFRTIYHIMPQQRWEEVHEGLLENPAIRDLGGDAVRMTVKGSPLIASGLEGFCPMGEPVCVYLNVDEWEAEELARIIEMLRAGDIRTDCLTVIGDYSAMPAVKELLKG